MQKVVAKWMFLVGLILLAGCQNPLTDHGEDYASRIHAIYADTPKTTLLFFGEKYQYVFPHVDANLAALLERKEDLGYTVGDEYESASLQMQIDILADGDPYLTLFMQLDGGALTEAQKGWLLGHDFEKVDKKTVDGAAIYAYNQQLNGKRYREKPNAIDMLESLSEGTLYIQGRDFSYQKNPQVAQSPVDIDEDGVSYAGKPFVPLPF